MEVNEDGNAPMAMAIFDKETGELDRLSLSSSFKELPALARLDLVGVLVVAVAELKVRVMADWTREMADVRGARDCGLGAGEARDDG